MNIPASVQVGPYQYEIEFGKIDMEDIGQPETHIAGATVLGMVDHSVLRITLDPDQAAGKMRDSLLHEVLHAVASLSDAIDPEIKESVVCALCTNLLDTLRRNPAFVAYLTAESE